MGLFGPPNIQKLKAKHDTPKLVLALDHKDQNIRESAALALGELKDPQTIQPLIDDLNAKSHPFNPAVIDALVMMGDSAARDLVMYYAFTPAVRPAIAQILARTGIPQTPQCINDLIWVIQDRYILDEHAHQDRCIAAASLLVQIGSAAVEPLIEALKVANSNEQKIIVPTLGEIGDQSAIPALVDLLRKNPENRKIVVTALDQIGWKPNRPEAEAQYWAAKEEWQKCVEIGEPAVAVLVNFIQYSSSPAERREMVQALSQLGEPGCQALTNIIHSDKPELASAAITAIEVLGEMGDARFVWPFIAKLEKYKNDLAVYPILIDSLAKIGSPSIEPLISVMRASSGLNQSASECLVKIGKPAAGPVIDVLFEKSLISTPQDAVFSPLFDGYSRLILDAVGGYGFSTRTNEVKYLDEGWFTEKWFDYNTRRMVSAVHGLCRINTPISSNILSKIINRGDIRIIIHTDELTSSTDYKNLDLDEQKETARQELKRRGNPNYDPSAYFVENSWKIDQ